MKKDFNNRSARRLGRKLMCQFAESSFFGYPAFVGVGENPNIPICLDLIAKGADITRISSEGYSFAHLAVPKNPKLMRAILESGQAPLNTQHKKSGKTALHAALNFSQYRENVVLLLEAGADPDIMDSTGVTAREMINKINDRQLTSLLQEMDAKKIALAQQPTGPGTDDAKKETAVIPEFKKVRLDPGGVQATP